MRVMATFRYRYAGDQLVHMPMNGASVKYGDTVKADHAIHHPDFEHISDDDQKKVGKRATYEHRRTCHQTMSWSASASRSR